MNNLEGNFGVDAGLSNLIDKFLGFGAQDFITLEGNDNIIPFQAGPVGRAITMHIGYPYALAG
jgi:hypothetical protein